MNWQRHYDTLIWRAKDRVIEGYSEKHHVLPRCLGGDDSFDNVVTLTPEEHYIAHLLLMRLHPGDYRMVLAVEMMTVASLRLAGRSQNKLCGWLKRRIAEARGCPEIRLLMRENALNDPRVMASIRKAQLASIGVPRPASTKKRISLASKVSKSAIEARKLLWSGKRGIPQSPEARAKMSKSHTGKKMTDEHRANIASALKGKPKSLEHNAKVSAALKGKPGTRRGVILTEETKRKMREAALNRVYSDESKKLRAAKLAAALTPEESTARALKAWATKRARAADAAERKHQHG